MEMSDSNGYGAYRVEACKKTNRPLPEWYIEKEEDVTVLATARDFRALQNDRDFVGDAGYPTALRWETMMVYASNYLGLDGKALDNFLTYMRAADEEYLDFTITEINRKINKLKA